MRNLLAAIFSLTVITMARPTNADPTYLVSAISSTTFPTGTVQFLASGYNAPIDGGGGTFVKVTTCAIDTGTCFQDNVGNYWQRLVLPNQPIDGRWFGMQAGDSFDNATVANNWLAALKTLSKAGYLPCGVYKTTKSLDFTFASSNAQGNNSPGISGESMQCTQIDGQLTEQYPVLDLSGMNYGFLRNLTVTTEGSSTSQATTAIFMAKGTSETGGGGNDNTLDHVSASVATSGNIYAQYGAVIYNSDVPMIIDSNFIGPGGLSIGGGRPSTVASKFQTTPSVFDFTEGNLISDVFNGSTQCPLLFSGGANLTAERSYVALVNSGGAPGIACVNSAVSNTGNGIYFYNLRTENQSTATGVSAMYFGTASTNGHVDGYLGTDTSGVAVKSTDTNYDLENFDINVTSNAGTILNLAAGINNSRVMVYDTTSVFGTIANLGATHTYNDQFNLGATVFSGTQSVVGGQPCVTINGQQTTARSANCFLYAPTDPTHYYFPGGVIVGIGATLTPYTGGSGEQLVYTRTIHGAGLTGWLSPVSAPFPAMDYTIAGVFNSAGAAGRIRLNFSQGSNNVNCLDTGAYVPAATSGGIRIKVHVQVLSSSAASAYCEIEADPSTDTGGTPFIRIGGTINLQSTFTTTADWNINIYETNSSNSAYNLYPETERIN